MPGKMKNAWPEKWTHMHTPTEVLDTNFQMSLYSRPNTEDQKNTKLEDQIYDRRTE